MTPNRWTESEIEATVRAYFELFEAERAGQPTNKAEVYRSLRAKFPARTAKAFELKFQNISAILYEQRLPFCAGLKPLSNYQRLLKLIVLDHIDRSPLPAVEPHEILATRLRDLKRKGPIRVRGGGTGRFGLALESALGIPQNSSKAPDFMGIELKTKSDNSPRTLFSRVPSRYVQDADLAGLFERHSYWDAKRGRQALYTSFTSAGDSLGFALVADDQVVAAARDGARVVEYDAEYLERALLSKHSQTAFIQLKRVRSEGKEMCEVTGAMYCKWPSIIRFLRLVEAGKIYLDFTMAQKPDGKLSNHGFLWKVAGDAVDQLYLHTERMDLNH